MADENTAQNVAQQAITGQLAIQKIYVKDTEARYVKLKNRSHCLCIYWASSACIVVCIAFITSPTVV